jgi:hypothetical protein
VQKCWAETILLSQTGLACFDFSSSKFKMTFIASNLTSILQFDKNVLNGNQNFIELNPIQIQFQLKRNGIQIGI